MRSFSILAGLATVASACELVYFKDELCAESTMETEEKQSASDEKSKTTLTGDWIRWYPGACHKYGTPIEIKSGDTKVKVGQTFGHSGVGSGSAAYMAFTDKVADECAYDPSKVDVEGNYKMFPGAEGAVNLCMPSKFYAPGISHKKSKDDGYFQRVTCGPAPGAIAGIVLGTLGIVFSLAGLGLAAAAGK